VGEGKDWICLFEHSSQIAHDRTFLVRPNEQGNRRAAPRLAK
jgi:hypothetical protein